MASEYTPNYNLDKYVGTDKPNLRDQYNTAMDKIDAQFLNVANDHTQTGNQISAINTNINLLDGRMTTAEGSITQLGERVTTAEGQIEQSGTELAKVKTTADNAMSLASTNESDISTLDSEMAQAQQDIGGLQSTVSQKAPIDHASAGTTYGQGTTTMFGHLKVTDDAGSTAASAGTAASPAGVQGAIRQWLTPRVVELPAPSSGSWYGTLNRCAVYDLWKNIKFTFVLRLTGTVPDNITIATCSELGIPNPAEDRTLFACVRNYARSPKSVTEIGNMKVLKTGEIQVSGKASIDGASVPWLEVDSIQVLIDYSEW